jgi:hypothetical protein
MKVAKRAESDGFESDYTRGIIGIEADASGALICGLMLVPRHARCTRQQNVLHLGADESFRRLSIDPREHIIKQAALPLRTMRSNASCSCRPCKPETTKQGIVKPVWRPKMRHESLACSRNCTHVHNMVPKNYSKGAWTTSNDYLFITWKRLLYFFESVQESSCFVAKTNGRIQ